MINLKYANGTQPANVLLSLRLAGIQNQALTQQVKHNVEMKGECLYSIEDLRKDLPI